MDGVSLSEVPPNSTELLASEEMEKLIKNLKEEYDYVIIDTNPIGLVADAQILSSKVDGVILVARYEKTKKENLLNCKKMIDQVGGNTIGVVLNGIDEKKGKYYYYYY